ncbi:hypothetical protein BC834DRAFT_897853 [Gloeopeniophorella convolvens]|nr:hypothetical protein BC834DRAFT_897853 [Gloeopeniophorella convolvens]
MSSSDSTTPSITGSAEDKGSALLCGPRFSLNGSNKPWVPRTRAPHHQHRFAAGRSKENFARSGSIRKLLRGALQLSASFGPAGAGKGPNTEFSVWVFGDNYKCGQIRRPDSSEDVVHVRMYESFSQVTIFLPDDFNGVVRRVGHSGSSISCSRAALYLKDAECLRFSGATADEAEDQVVVRTEKMVHVCVAGDDPLVPRTGRLTPPALRPSPVLHT